MKIVSLTKKNSGGVLLLGGFDGMHLGHRQLLLRAKESGKAVGVSVILGNKGEPLYTARERKELFFELEADYFVELPFEEIRALSAQEFLSLLERELAPEAYICGEDFRFGYGASGDGETLKRYAPVPVSVEPLLYIGGEKVGSGKIKALLAEGKIKQANALLGRNFFLLGEVERDRQVGNEIGFPTANIRYPKEKFPLKIGVYQTLVAVDGKEYKAITNFGARPTFENGEVWTETHLLDFNGDLYGKTLSVSFVKYLREVKKFESVEALKEQLKKDKEYARTH